MPRNPMHRTIRPFVVFTALLIGAASCSKAPEQQAQNAPMAPDTMATAEHGAYLATISGCHDCHTPGAFYGAPDFQRALSGSELGWTGPWGTTYARNLTPDPTTGIASWSEDDIIRALQTGKRPDGTDIKPPMPWPNYAHLTPKDIRSIAKYLRALVPIAHAVPATLPPGQKARGGAFVLPPPPAWDAPKAAPPQTP